MQTILRDGEAPLMVLAMVTRHFRQLWQVREMMDKRLSEQEIGKKLGINPYFLKGVVNQARNFSVSDCRKLFERLFAADLAMKSGGKPAMILGDLIISICSAAGGRQ
jgi:DNA polymerase-3 subunit delta